MSFPEPRPGLVIRYSYLWASEQDQGREEGVKDRPCAVLLALREEAGDIRVIVLPVTHTPPRNAGEALEIPAPTRRRLGLDDEPSWIVLTEGHAFYWPGPDLRPMPDGGPESVALGLLPARFFKQMRDGFLNLHNQRNGRFVTRSE